MGKNKYSTAGGKKFWFCGKHLLKESTGEEENMLKYQVLLYLLVENTLNE